MIYKDRQMIGSIGGLMTIANHGAREIAARARTGISKRWMDEARARYGDLPEEELRERAERLYRADMTRRSRLGCAARRERSAAKAA